MWVVSTFTFFLGPDLQPTGKNYLFMYDCLSLKGPSQGL